MFAHRYAPSRWRSASGRNNDTDDVLPRA
jgi:hypothetical protein